jgi:hypothetical protein
MKNESLCLCDISGVGSGCSWTAIAAVTSHSWQLCVTIGEPPPQERTEGNKCGDRHDLSAKNDPIEIERRPPGSVTVLDDEDASGSRAEAKANTALFVSPFSCATAAADDGDRQNRGAIGLNRIAENPAGGDRVLCVDENMLCVHERLQRGACKNAC